MSAVSWCDQELFHSLSEPPSSNASLEIFATQNEPVETSETELTLGTTRRSVDQEEIDLAAILLQPKLLHPMNEILVSLLLVVALGREEDFGGEEDRRSRDGR